jgi:hypothetical protein
VHRDLRRIMAFDDEPTEGKKLDVNTLTGIKKKA